MVFLIGCMLALGIAFAPRVMLVLAWIFSDRWTVVWQGNWIAPLLGIIFLPYTTIMYVLVWKPTGIDGWDWMWIILGLLLDVMHWQQTFVNRKQVPGYATASGSSGLATSTTSSGMATSTTSTPASPGTVPAATTPSAPSAPPAAPPPVPEPATLPTPPPAPGPEPAAGQDISAGDEA
jgi:hypothetical protein